MPVIGVVEPGARAAVAATTRWPHRRHRHRRARSSQARTSERFARSDPDVHDHAARLSALRSARRRRLDRSRGHAPRRAGIPRADRWKRRSTRWCSAARTIRCSSRCCATCSVRTSAHRQRRGNGRRNGPYAFREREISARSDAEPALSVHRVRRSAAVSSARAALSWRTMEGVEIRTLG